ncbi:GGDEF domain-containing protein [Saccharopolyspora phatthalungensis]|nr:GGDEF domain-containing protein [Saccharopolyspora phatthalungensis]
MIRPPTAPTTVDKLTGLPDRWAWETHAAHLLNNARNTGDHVALLLVDLDHFKAINDTWGHLAGDAVLAGVARVLRTVVSFGNGVIGRYGGDEFLVMLAHGDIQRPIQVAESLLRHIADLAVTVTATSGNQVLLTDISASIGLTTTPPDKLGCIGRLVLAADAALLHAKQNGRNQVRAGDERLAIAQQSVPQAQLIQQHFPESPVQALDHNACLQHLRNFFHMVACFCRCFLDPLVRVVQAPVPGVSGGLGRRGLTVSGEFWPRPWMGETSRVPSGVRSGERGGELAFCSPGVHGSASDKAGSVSSRPFFV